MNTNTLFIFGVGRSGTTALFHKMQDMFYAEFGDNIRSIYEPFLWDWKVFDKPADEVTTEFSLMSSVSHEGIVESKRLPMLISPENLDNFTASQFLHDISCCPPDKAAIISKMIRANGRYHLFKHLSPGARSIFIIRNPIDVVNSSSEMFSFYGEDFHASDYPRFQEEVFAIYGEFAKNLPRTTYVQKQAFYWYFMNRYFLESCKDDSTVLLLTHDEYLNAAAATHQKICAFLELDQSRHPFKESHKRTVGPTYGSMTLSRTEIEGLQVYLDLYQDLLQAFFPDASEDINRIRTKYAAAADSPIMEDPFLGKTPLYLKAHINKMQRQHAQEILANSSLDFSTPKGRKKAWKKLRQAIKASLSFR